METAPELFQTLANAGHEISNYGYDLATVVAMPTAQLQANLERTENVIVSVTGRSSQPRFWPPLGLSSEQSIQAAFEAGYTFLPLSVMLSADPTLFITIERP